MSRTIHVVIGIGGRARHRDRVLSDVVAAAQRHGWTVTEVGPDALAAQRDTIERVVLCGGDGLVHRCLPDLAHTGIEVGLVPIGTGNDFARAFGITRRHAIQIATADHGARPVDLIRAGDRYAASVVTAGYSGRVNASANSMRLPPGSAKYTVAAVREIGRLATVPVHIALDGSTVITADLTLLAVGNTPYFGGGMRICPSANPTDGMLELVTVGALGRVEFARWLPRVFRGSHLDHDAVQVTRAHTITIETDEPLWADGEPFAAAPITLTADQGALELLTAPADGHGRLPS